MEDDHNTLVNGRQPQYLANGRWHQLFYNGRQPECFDKLKTTSMFWQMEDDINRRQTHCFQLEDDLNFLIGKAGLANPSLSWAWHSSAPACCLSWSLTFI